MVLCRIFENPVTVHEDNQGAVAHAVSPQMWPHTKHIAIKYYHFWSFVANGDVEIKHVDNMEQIADIFTNLLDSELFGFLHEKINGW